MCGKKRAEIGGLHDAHIVSRVQGGNLTIKLCPNCHSKYDNGLASSSFLGRLGITSKQYDAFRGGRVGKKNPKKRLLDSVARDIVTPQKAGGRRKIMKNELKSHINSLSSQDFEVRAESLKQLAEMAFVAEIETDGNLLRELARLVDDKNLKVRRSALYLFERLSWRILPSYRTRYNKRLLPMIVKAALNDEDTEVRRNALEGIVASKDEVAVDVFTKLVTALTEEQYKRVIQDNTWTSIIYNGLGPKLRQHLLNAFERSPGTIRDRISKETASRSFG
jgi:hypothetical protein